MLPTEQRSIQRRWPTVSGLFWVFCWFTYSSTCGAQAADAPQSMRLPVPRTVELTHVRPKHFAAALGKDSARIFAFVRDQVEFEAYQGILRGPRGTLLALAGNSVDQAFLLGSLLETAGYKVRFAYSRLETSLAERLVDAMLASPATVAAEKPASKSIPDIENAIQTLMTNSQRDYALILERLRQEGLKHGAEAAVSRATLVEEAREHYWVQIVRDGAWVDLDPTGADAQLNARMVKAETTFPKLPDSLYHRIEIRLHLEERSEAETSTRIVLEHETTAAALSGLDFGLVHMPENWTGPAASLQAALASAITETGRIRPVLLITETGWIPGQPFYQEPPPSGGLSGVFTQLKGIGTRHAVPIATAERLEIDLISPDGRKETVSRQIFDRVGMARRQEEQPLSAEEVRTLTVGADGYDASAAYFDILVTTGRLASQHLPREVDEAAQLLDPEFPDLLAALRQVNIGLVSTMDAWLARLDWPGDRSVRFYPVSPRLVAMEFIAESSRARATIDLRRTTMRMAAQNLGPDQTFAVNVYRGVMEGATERMIMDFIAARGPPQGRSFNRLAGTSALFERARADDVPLVLLRGSAQSVESGEARDGLAWLERDLAQGFIAVSPERAIAIDDNPRLAWWRLDPATGETIAVGDNGLHQATAEIYVQHQRNNHRTVVTSRVYVNGQYVRTETLQYSRLAHNRQVVEVFGNNHGFAGGVRELNRDLAIMRDIGSKVITGAPPPL